MATSSLAKSFVLKTKKETANFVKLFSEQENQKPLKDVHIRTLSQEHLIKLIHAKRK